MIHSRPRRCANCALPKAIKLLRLHRNADNHERVRIGQPLQQAVDKGWFSAAEKKLFEYARPCLDAEPDGSLEHCLHRAGVAMPERLRDAGNNHS